MVSMSATTSALIDVGSAVVSDDEEPTTSFQKKFEEDTFYSQEKLYKVRVYI